MTTPHLFTRITEGQRRQGEAGLHLETYEECVRDEMDPFMESFLRRNPLGGFFGGHIVTSRELLATFASGEPRIRPFEVLAVKHHEDIYMVLKNELGTPSQLELALNGLLAGARNANDRSVRRGIFRSTVRGRRVVYWSPVEFKNAVGEFVSVVPIHPDPNGLDYQGRPHHQYPPNFLINNARKAYWTAFFGRSDHMIMPIIRGTAEAPVAETWLEVRTDVFETHLIPIVPDRINDSQFNAVLHLEELFNFAERAFTYSRRKVAIFSHPMQGMRVGPESRVLVDFYRIVNRY